jgi:hypothetical protein
MPLPLGVRPLGLDDPGDKLARAKHRFRPDRPAARRRTRLLDMIGGAPSRT